jgi:cation diffusion facilitator CzcD-associated flavoprotein CzcO
MCDVESYIYLPLLEETGYMPKHKYSSGHEIRTYLDSLAQKFGLHSRALFQTNIEDLKWSDDRNHWTCKLTENPKGAEQRPVSLNADYVLFATGPLSNPHLPNLPGFEEYNGQIFHTARWNYGITGGSETQPNLTNLSDKKVAIIGTGTSSVQAVPNLARFCKELCVVQRTPSAVDERNNYPTDPTWFKQVTSDPGWQEARNVNLNAFLNNTEPKPEVDLVDDGFSHWTQACAIIGGPKKVTMENVGEYVKGLQEMDLKRQERLRRGVKRIVGDGETAEVCFLLGRMLVMT